MTTIRLKTSVAALLVAVTSSCVATAAEQDNTCVFSRVENPDVPLSMSFAGQKIDLDRVDMFERLDRELTAMTYTHGSTLLLIKRANKYFPAMAPILKENGVPLDLLYLACVESTLNIRAYSGAKAAGLWQFMAATAKQYGLEVSDYVDERYNVEKATAAACRYLKEAYGKYGNWESVASSYNAGMGRITSELSSQQVSTSFDLHLVDETTRYMYRIMATKLIMEQPAKYGFRLSRHQLYQPAEYVDVRVDTTVVDWPTWAVEHGITYAQLREHNPWIRAKSLPNKVGKTYVVKVPTKESLYRSKQKKTLYNKNWVVR